MNKGVTKQKSFEFAVDIVELATELREKRKEFILSKQVMRSGTSIGALVREAEYAESKADFVHKLSVALKEANETEYWLEILLESHFIENEVFQNLNKKLKELLRLLISSINTTKRNL